MLVKEAAAIPNRDASASLDRSHLGLIYAICSKAPLYTNMVLFQYLHE